MKAFLLPTLSLITMGLAAQQSKTMFAVTGSQPGDVNWTKVRKLSGEGQVLLDGFNRGKFVQAQSGEAVVPQLNARRPDEVIAPSGIAALAYDRKNNLLFFAPMFRQEGIRYINLADKAEKPTVHVFANSTNLIDRQKDGEGPNITRMTMGPGEVGYALSNDGYSFLRFSAGKKKFVENLGALVDAESNGARSVHNQCDSWGGDMVAAANGDLYLFTVRHQVYKINPQTRVTTYLGKVAGIDASFTINGAAVDEKGQVLLASSTQPKLLYVIADMNRLEATPEKNDNWLNASDLASSNLLFSNKPATNWDLPPVRTPGTDAVSVFPNPVDKGFFIVAFDNLPLGRYSIDLLNGAGSAALTQNVQVREKGQTVRVNTASFAKGLYVMRIIDADRKQVHTQKVILQ